MRWLQRLLLAKLHTAKLRFRQRGAEYENKSVPAFHNVDLPVSHGIWETVRTFETEIWLKGCLRRPYKLVQIFHECHGSFNVFFLVGKTL